MEQVSVWNLNAGRFLQKLDAEVQRAIADCKARPELTGKREVTLKIVIEPSYEADPRDEREKILSNLTFSYVPTVKLPAASQVCSAMVDLDGTVLTKSVGDCGSAQAVRQGDIEDMEQERSNVVGLNRRE